MLTKHDKLVTLEGKKIELCRPLNDGGHCSLYRVIYNDEPHILKWFENNDFIIGNSYYITIERIMELFKDYDELVSPKAIVIISDPDDNSRKFGYLANVIPENYYELYDFFRCSNDPKAVGFSSYEAQIDAAIRIVSFLQKIHIKGCSMNLTPEDIFVNKDTGEIRIVNSEKISYDICVNHWPIHDIVYLAPEINRSEKNNGRWADYYSLAIVLYRLFFIDHPMEGKAWEKYPFYTQKIEEYLYVVNPVFHFDPANDSNRPTDVYAPNATRRWEAMPQELRTLFIRTFTEGINEPKKRPSENEWISILARTRDKLIRINQTIEQFVDFSDLKSIPPKCLALKIGSHRIAIYPKKAIYQISVDGNAWEYATIVGGVVYDKQSDRLKLRNLSSKVWRCCDPTTKQLTDVGKGQEYPLYPGVMIEFHGGQPKIVGEIIDPKATL